jgi:hypothetical protein
VVVATGRKVYRLAHPHAIGEQAMKRSNAKKLAEMRINRAVVGFRIPMMEIPKLYRTLETAIAENQADESLKAIVAAFPGVIAVSS